MSAPAAACGSRVGQALSIRSGPMSMGVVVAWHLLLRRRSLCEGSADPTVGSVGATICREVDDVGADTEPMLGPTLLPDERSLIFERWSAAERREIIWLSLPDRSQRKSRHGGRRAGTRNPRLPASVLMVWSTGARPAGGLSSSPDGISGNPCCRSGSSRRGTGAGVDDEREVNR